MASKLRYTWVRSWIQAPSFRGHLARSPSPPLSDLQTGHPFFRSRYRDPSSFQEGTTGPSQWDKTKSFPPVQWKTASDRLIRCAAPSTLSTGATALATVTPPKAPGPAIALDLFTNQHQQPNAGTQTLQTAQLVPQNRSGVVFEPQTPDPRIRVRPSII